MLSCRYGQDISVADTGSESELRAQKAGRARHQQSRTGCVKRGWDDQGEGADEKHHRQLAQERA